MKKEKINPIENKGQEQEPNKEKKTNKKPPPEIVYKSEDLIKLNIIEERFEPLPALIVPDFLPSYKSERRDYKALSKAFEKVCNIIANKGLSMTAAIKFNNQNNQIKISRDIFYFLIQNNFSYQDYYTQATEKRADLLVEKSLSSSLNGDDDWYFNEKGVRLPNPVKVQRDRLKMDAIKWVSSKMNPRKYGDKIEIDAKIVTQNIMTLDDAKAIIKELEG